MAQTAAASTSLPVNPAGDADATPQPFASAKGIVIGAILLWVVGIVAAAAGSAAQRSLTVEDPAGRIFASYLVYVPSIVMFLAGTIALIIGSIRWAMYGQDAVGVSSGVAAGGDADLLRSINDRLLLSDTAKRIAYRQHDLAALRRAIREDIDKGAFDAALVLVQEMSQTFGYREEAEQFREQIMGGRAAEQTRKIDAAMEQLNELIAKNDFRAAGLMAAKMARLFPENERESKIVDYVEEMREHYKLRVEREFLAAQERGEVDKAMDLLKVLDHYLNPKEAESFREIARNVIGQKRDNLGVQFKMAVHDQEWTRAVAVGEQIIREFPNTRMADEVRSMLDQLRTRAAAQRAAQA